MPFISVLIILILYCSIVNATFSIHVGYKEESCFIIRTPAKSSSSFSSSSNTSKIGTNIPESFLIAGSFEVLDDELSPDPISVVIFPEKSKAKSREYLYQSEKNSRWDTFGVIIPTGGRYSICVQHSLRNLLITKKIN
jgi:hypothetical protein